MDVRLISSAGYEIITADTKLYNLFGDMDIEINIEPYGAIDIDVKEEVPKIEVNKSGRK